MKKIIPILVLLMSLFACQKKEEIIEGGTTDRSDLNAPKEISSKEIESFYAYFYIDQYEYNGLNLFEFEAIKKEDHVLIKELISGKEAKVNLEILEKLQMIIDEEKLVLENGVHKLTAGIAPRYYKSALNVIYESEEVLSFTKGNDPAAIWAIQVYETFVHYFIEAEILDFSLE